MQETWVQSLSQEDPLEKGMATHSSILAWRIPWTEEPGAESDMTEQLTLSLSLTSDSHRTVLNISLDITVCTGNPRVTSWSNSQ